MAKTRLGFDLGSSSMKIALVRDGAVSRLESVRLPENMIDSNGAVTLPHAFIQFLRQTRRELSLPRAAAALVLPASQVICRMVTMPRMTAGQLAMNLPYEFSDFIQGGPEQYHCDYALCRPVSEEEENAMPMMAAVASKNILTSYYRMFTQAGISLKIVLPQEMALIQLVQRRQEGKEFCFVDLGHLSTRITVVRGDRIQATRQIALGGRNMDMLIADELGIDAFLAGTYKMENYQDIQSGRGVAEVCDRIAVEILKVINFYQFTYRSSELEGIYLAGGGAGIPALREAVSGMVGLELLDPGELLDAPEQETAAGIFAAGAALGGQP